MLYYLGIDGGGTKTTSAVGDDSRLLATATAGPSNIVRVGESQARESLQQSALQACAAFGITLAEIAHTCVGAAGAARPELAATMHRILAELVSTPIDVVGDMEIALEAAFGTGPGVIVIAGTGSIAYGRDRSGATARAGGLGFAIGDEGSAHWIGRSVLAALLNAIDRTGREQLLHSKLAAALCNAWQVDTLDDLARAANATPPPDFAALFPAVAASKDDMALEVLSRAGKELAHTAAAVIVRLFAADEPMPVPIAMTGGVFRHSPLVGESFYGELRQMDARVELNPNIVDPVEGALNMARKAGSRKV